MQKSKLKFFLQRFTIKLIVADLVRWQTDTTQALIGQ